MKIFLSFLHSTLNHFFVLGCLDLGFDFKFNDILAAVIKISVICLVVSVMPFEESLKFLFIKSVNLFKHTGVPSAALQLTLDSELQWKLEGVLSGCF